jgi:hypothetical protein
MSSHKISFMKVSNLIINSFFLLILSACQAPEPTAVDLPPVDFSKLEYGDYLERFNNKAIEKGLDIERELAELAVEVTVNYAENEICNNVLLLTEDYEILFKQNYIEQILFHQIAHCVLDRAHTDEKLPNGEWKSIMRNRPYLGNESQSIDYNDQKKEYYLEELFDETTNAADYFNPEPIDFDENIEKELIEKLDCNVDYLDLIPDDIDAEVTIKFSLEAPLEDLAVFLIRRQGEYMKLWFNRAYNDLLFRDYEYGKRYQIDIDNFIVANEDIRFNIRKIGDYYTFYINEQYLFSYYEKAGIIDDVKASANDQVGCGPEVKIFEILE